MSFINISTNQQTSAQREATERTPANLRNDFKVPIEIKKGDQIELVSLRLHLGTSIRINENENDTLVWTWGNAPNWTQHVAQMPSGAYYDGFEIGKVLTTSLNESTTIPSFDSSTYPQHRFNPTIEGGWSVTFAPGAGGAADTYTIDNQQCTYMTDVTNGKIAQGHHGNNFRTGLTQLHSLSDTPFGVANAIPEFENLAGEVTMRQSWISEIHDPDPSFTGAEYVLESLESGELADAIVSEPCSNVLNGYLGRNFDCGQMNNVANFRAGDEALQNSSNCISSIYDNGGKVFCTTSPVWGFFLADFTDDANLVGPDIDLDIEMGLNGDDEAEVIEQRTFVITKLANPGAADNHWHLQLDLKAGQAPFNPLMPGVSGATFTRLYMHYIPETGLEVATAESPFKNGSWAIGGYVDPAAPGGGDGVPTLPVTAPDDALEPDNWNFCTDTGIDPGAESFGHRNIWYYDIITGTFQPGIQYDGMEDRADIVRLDYRKHKDPNGRDTGNDETPSLRPNAGGGFDLTMTRHLGYNPVRVGLNNVGQYVNSNYKYDFKVNQEGTQAFGDQENGHQSCRWQIQLFNDPDQVTLDGNGVLFPRLQVIGTENPETEDDEKYGFRSKVYLDTDVQGVTPALTPLTHDLVVCVEITKVQTLNFYCIQHPKYTLTDPNPPGPAPGDKYQTDAGNTPTDAELQANLVFTLDNTGTQDATTDLSYIKESHYPLVPVVACGAGGYYAATTLAAEQVAWGDEIGSYNCWDMQLAYRDPAGIKNREIYEAFPQRTIEETVTIAPGGSDPPTAISGSGYCFKFGRLQLGQTGASLNDDPTVANHYVTGSSSATTPFVNTVISELLPPNISNLQRILGFENLVQSTRDNPHFNPALVSTRQVNQMPIAETFTVELTSSNVKGFNGGTGDVNKALAVINAEELEIDGDGGVIWASQTRRPVDLNVTQDTSFHSLNIQLRDANGKIMRTVEAPLDVVLYKSQPESTKMEQALRELREVMEGKRNDIKDVQLANIGINNPILGVIPR